MPKWKEVKARLQANSAPVDSPAPAPPETAGATLEQALLFLAGRCDGASSRDGRGFNGADAGYGHWLADRISQGKPLIHKWAESAYRMTQKYQGQLESAGIRLPTWEAIAPHYPAVLTTRSATESESEYRIWLTDDGKHLALVSPYSEIHKLNPLYKSVTGHCWHRIVPQAWSFPVEEARALKTALGDYWKDFEISEAVDLAIAQQEAAELQRAIEIAEGIIQLIEAAKLDETLPNGRSLYAHQKEAAQWLLSRRRGGIYRGGILADHMGLGKTCSALVAARAMVAVHQCPVFVVCPASLKDNWLREAEGVGVAIEVFSWAKLPKPLEHSQYLLIADEAHYAQDSRSQRTQALLELAESPNCLAAWLLTGTPLKNGRPINLFPLLQAAGHTLAADKFHYQKYFCNAGHKSIGRGKSVWDVSGAAHLNELAQKTADVILRRTKKECLDLPQKIRQLKPAEVSPATEKAYSAQVKQLVEDYRKRIAAASPEEREKLRTAEALVTIGHLRRVGSIAKVEAVQAMAEDLLEQGQPVVIFTEFVESAQALRTALGGELLTGDTPGEERQALVDRFQSGESKVFVGTIRAGGVGITLTAASYVILCDRPWTPGDAEQAEDRCHRIGQNETVNALWVQFGQIDTAIDALLESKQERIELVLKGKRKTLRGLASPAELAKELLEIL